MTAKPQNLTRAEDEYRKIARDLRVPVKQLKACWPALVEAGLATFYKPDYFTPAHVALIAGREAEVFERVFWYMYERTPRTADDNGSKQNPPFLREGVALRIWRQIRIPPHTVDDAADLASCGERSVRRWFEEEKPGRAAFGLFEEFLWKYDFIDVFQHVNIATDIELINYPSRGKDKDS